MEGIEIEPQESGFCRARCYPLIVANRIEGAVVPEVSGYLEMKNRGHFPLQYKEGVGSC
jgi:hypothetical protein